VLRRTDVQAWLKQQLGLNRSRFRNPPGGFDAVEDCIDAARITPLSRFDPRRVSLRMSASLLSVLSNECEKKCAS